MKAKKIKKASKSSNLQSVKLEKEILKTENLAQTIEFQASLSPELDEILKKKPNHFLGCGG